MAGDEKEIGTELPDVSVEDPFERLARILAGREGDLLNIYRELADVGNEILPFFAAPLAVVTNVQQQHMVFRVKTIIIASDRDSPSLYTLNVGTGIYPFGGSFGPPTAFPFPIVIGRGMDVSWSLSNAPAIGFAAYLIGRPE